MKIKIIPALSLAALAVVSNPVFAESSDSFSATISFTVPAICKADVLSVSTNDIATEVDIRELCNVGGGHDVVLIHDGLAEASEASYHSEATTIETTGRTIIASRDGAYHGKRRLVIPHVNGEPVQIHGVYVNRGTYAGLSRIKL